MSVLEESRVYTPFDLYTWIWIVVKSHRLFNCTIYRLHWIVPLDWIMVFILNGECLPDSDPRAVAARNGKNNNSKNRNTNTSRGGFGSLNASSSSTSAASSTSTAPTARGGNGGGGGPLNALAKMMGIDNQFLSTPAVGTYLPPTKVPYVYLVVLAILTYMFGIRAPLVAIVCWYIYHHQQTNSWFVTKEYYYAKRWACFLLPLPLSISKRWAWHVWCCFKTVSRECVNVGFLCGTQHCSMYHTWVCHTLLHNKKWHCIQLQCCSPLP